jgi:hypothetical protein
MLALAGTLLGTIGAWVRPRSRQVQARVLDLRLGLAERLTTALEIGTGQLPAPATMAQAQLADTVATAAQVIIRERLPIRIPRRALAIGATLMAAVTLSLALPNPHDDVLLQQQMVQAAIEEQIEALEAIEEEIEQAEGLTEEEREALLQALQEAIAELENGEATLEEAVTALSDAEQTLADLQDPGAAEIAAGLEEAAEAVSDSELTQAIAEALAQGDYEAAAQALAAFAGDEGEALTRTEELELAEQLVQAAEAIADSNPALAEQLAEAAEAIQEGGFEAAREAIARAAGEMAAAGDQVERQEMVEDTLSAIQEGREAIAEAGGQPGAGPVGQPGDQGQGEGSAGGQQPGSGQQTQPGHSEDSGSGAPYSEVYVPERIKEEGSGVELGREGEEGQPGEDSPLPAPEGGAASIPYEEVYAEYATAAQAALESSYIPLGMKQYIRDYFTSLEP